jgi:hypothetical protein
MILDRETERRAHSERREHKARLQRRAAWIWLRVWGNQPWPEWAQANGDNRKPCSCYMCGNPRKWYGSVTFQEQRALFG